MARIYEFYFGVLWFNWTFFGAILTEKQKKKMTWFNIGGCCSCTQGHDDGMTADTCCRKRVNEGQLRLLTNTVQGWEGLLCKGILKLILWVLIILTTLEKQSA